MEKKLNDSNEKSIDKPLNESQRNDNFEESKEFKELERLYNEYLHTPISNPEKRNSIGIKVLEQYYSNEEKFKSYNSEIEKIMEEIEWRTDTTTSALKRLNEAFVSLSDAKEVELIKNKGIKTSNKFDLLSRLKFIHVGKHYKKYPTAMSYVSIYVSKENENKTRLCMINFDNFAPIEILDTNSSDLEIKDITEQIFEFIGDKSVVSFDAKNDLALLKEYGLNFKDINVYSEKDLLFENKEITPVDDYTLDEAAKYFVFDYDKNDPRECCYIVGRIFENMINSITDKRDRYFE